MATISVKIEVKSAIPEVGAVVRQQAGKAIAKAALDISTQAKVRAPVDTGLLKNSITAEQVAPFAWVVESPVHYSIYQEYGTSRMPAQPYMTPAVEFVKPSFEAAMRRLIP